MAQKAYSYDGTAWRDVSTIYAYDGTAWREIDTGYVYDGTAWRQFWTACRASLVTAVHLQGEDGTDGCTSPFCTRCVEWTYTDAGHPEHIRILLSLNGGSYFEEADDLTVGNNCSGGTSVCSAPASGGCYSAGCYRDTTTTRFQVRLEEDGGDSLACGDSGNQITTGQLSGCAVT